MLTLNEEELKNLNNTVISGINNKFTPYLWTEFLLGTPRAPHYDSFRTLVQASMIPEYIKQYHNEPDCLIVSSSLISVLYFCNGFNLLTGASSLHGPYISGTLDNLLIVVSPNLEHKFILTNYKDICEDSKYKIDGSFT